ncbi:TetR/AcrR family transcriptional regulator [Spongiactinospora sp. 9N601]|uniref:TetR/AcrR family transcriptional regulator n=1 Tax=Spongiactinospora sp. 9N601 TaxID=3375149 RepID=UPI0037B5E704
MEEQMADPIGDPALSDLTARARIRDAALRLFADRGIDKATIRDIAREASVSLGLVRHHFGSKEGLRDACDAYALEQLLRVKKEALREGRQADPGFLPSVHPTVLLLQRYFSHSMLDGSAAAAAMFDHMVGLAEEWVRDNVSGVADVRAFAAMLVAMQFGPLVMHEQVSRALGADVLAPDGHLRMSMAALEIHATPLLPEDYAAEARAGYDRLAAQRRSAARADPEVPA